MVTVLEINIYLVQCGQEQNWLRFLIPKVINETESIIIQKKIQTHSLQGFINYIKQTYIQKCQMDCLILTVMYVKRHNTATIFLCV